MIDLGISSKKKQLRIEIEKQVMEYLDSGGEINNVPMGAMKYPDRYANFNTDSDSVKNLERYFNA